MLGHLTTLAIVLLDLQRYADQIFLLSFSFYSLNCKYTYYFLSFLYEANYSFIHTAC